MVFLGGLAYTRESEKGMEPMAAADRRRKEPKVARLACLTLAKKKNLEEGKGGKRLLKFCQKIMPFEAIFLL